MGLVGDFGKSSIAKTICDMVALDIIGMPPYPGAVCETACWHSCGFKEERAYNLYEHFALRVYNHRFGATGLSWGQLHKLLHINDLSVSELM